MYDPIYTTLARGQDAEAFDACSFGAPGAARNEAIPGSELVVDPSGVLELTVGGLEEGTIYFACGVGSHCFGGQKIEVKVAAAEPEPGAECPSIVDVALSVPDLSILVDAVVAANLTDVLSVGEDVYTVFAPTNGAFLALLGALGAEGLEDISVDTLTDVLLYHVVPGVAAYSTDLFDGQVIPTALEGLGLTVDLSDGVVIGGVGSDAAVIIPDVPACASVVHVIDAVLLPFGGAPAPEPEEGPFVVGLGEECNPTVSPAFQTICDDGLSCEVPAGLLGASGVCVED